MKQKIDWDGCKMQGLAKEVAPDFFRIKSIIESANNREKTVRLIPLNETSKETVISLWYDVVRELLEAAALKNGFKIYNHECYTSFLRSVLHDGDFALEFDSLRLLRNSINYYGKKIGVKDAEIILLKLEKLIRNARKMLEKQRTDVENVLKKNTEA